MRRLLNRLFSFKEIGWTEVGEEFTRWTLFRCSRFSVYLHRMWAPNPHPQGCHTHPWDFVAIVLWGGYYETKDGKTKYRWPGSVLWRPAETSHETITGRMTNWSVILAGPKRRDWGFQACEGEHV